MQNERLAELLELEQSDNQDPMIKYCIALEYKKKSDKRCEGYFLRLINEHPQYLATYYIAGEYFYNQEDYTQSLTILRQGLMVAKEQKNQKAIAEIGNLLMNVEFEVE